MSSINIFKKRGFYYTVAALLVVAINLNAVVEPASARFDYLLSRQQSVIEREGRWDTLDYDSPVNSVHAALLNTGKVLLIAGSGNDEKTFENKSFRTVVWDPKTGEFKEIPTPWDAFCAGHAFLPDGRLLVAGGTKGYEDLDIEPRLEYQGLKDAYIFDPATERYDKVQDMQFARWYPTLVGLPDGNVLAAAGLDENGKKSSGETEIFNKDTNTWSLSPNLTRVFPTYPSLTLSGDGRLFYSGSHQGYEPGAESLRPGIWDLKTNQYQYVEGLSEAHMTNNSSTVLLPPAQDQRVMMFGGAGNGDSPITTERTAIVDLDASAKPSYVRGPNMQASTRYPGLVILPDDTVFETGGSSGYRTNDKYLASIFNPKTNTFVKAASPQIGRNYHAEAILLPDGRVATFGSNPIDNTFEMRIEVYSPAYMFKGARPVITGGAKELQRGTTSSFTVKNSGSIKTAKLMRPSAVTHVTDGEQRSVDLPITKTASGVDVQIPANASLLPSGWYMAVVTNDKDIPSEAYWVHVQ